MKKARKIKIDGIEYKYFLDTSRGHRIILYTPNNHKRYWNISMDMKPSNTDIKEAFLNGKFGGEI